MHFSLFVILLANIGNFFQRLAEYSLGNKELSKELLKEAINLHHADYLFPEYNAVYEHFPYEVTKSNMQAYLELLK